MNFSYWEKQFLSDNADLTIIGAGITGLSAAYHTSLRHPNWRIVVLEKFPFSNAASTRNAGFSCFGSAGELVDDLTSGSSMDELLSTVEKRFKGLQLLRSTLGDDRLEYSECGGLELFDSSQQEELLKVTEHIDLLNKELRHITSTNKTYKISETPKALNHFTDAINNSLEGKLNPGKMMKGWADLCEENNITTYRGASATIDQDAGGVYFGSHFIRSKQIAVCTNGLSKSLNLDLDVLPARNLVLLSKPLKNINLPATYHHLQGYMYFRKIHDRVLLGGARHLFKEQEFDSEFSVQENLKTHLLTYLKKHIGISEDDIEYEWTGIMGVGNSKETIVKRINDQLVCGVRLGGMGVAIGSLIGKEVSELVN